MKLYFSQINAIYLVINGLMGTTKTENTKFKIAFNSHNKKKLNKIIEQVDEELYEKKIDLSLVGPNKEVLKDEKGDFKYSKEGLKELNRFMKKQMDKIFEVDFYKVPVDALAKEEIAHFGELNEDGTIQFNDKFQDTELNDALRCIVEFNDGIKPTEAVELEVEQPALGADAVELAKNRFKK